MVNRKYWESKSTADSVRLADKIVDYIEPFAPDYGLKYNKHYIGLAKDGISQNFISFIPRRRSLLLHIKHEQTEEIEKILSESDFEVLSYDRRWKQHRLRLTEKDIDKNKESLTKLIILAFESYMA